MRDLLPDKDSRGYSCATAAQERHGLWNPVRKARRVGAGRDIELRDSWAHVLVLAYTTYFSIHRLTRTSDNRVSKNMNLNVH